MTTQHPPVLIGGGGHARSLLAMTPAASRPATYVDSTDTLPTLRRLGDDDAFLSNPDYAGVPVIIGFVAGRDCSMLKRAAMIAKYAAHPFATIIAPTAFVAPDCVLGCGTTIFHRAVLNTGVITGSNVVINTGAIVEHDVTIGNNTFIGPGAIIAGGVTIGDNVYIGAGAVVRNGISIQSDTTVGMAAAVTHNITEYGTYAGNPCRKL